MKRLRRRPALLFALLFAVVSCSDPGWPPSTSEDAVQAAFSSLRQGTEGAAGLSGLTGKAFILTLYDGHGARRAFGHKEFTKLFLSIKDLNIINSYLTLNIITKVSKIRVKTLSKLGLNYEKGLQGLALADDSGTVFALDPTYLAAHDIDFDRALELLKQGKGIVVKGLDLKRGHYLLTCESFTEPEPGAIPIPLFRANHLFEQATPTLLRTAVVEGGNQLVNLQLPSGRFSYTYDTGADVRNNKNYNLLRHAGTCYSLFMLYGETKNERFLQAGRRGMDWLESRIHSPNWDTDRAYPVFHKKAKLGGAALSLLAMCERVKVDPEFQVTPLMHKLAAHLRKEQRKDGSFRSYYSWDRKPVKKRFSIYYPGEAILALIRYAGLIKQPEASLDVAVRGANFLIDKRWRIVNIEVYVPPDAWLMMALHELWLVRPNPSFAEYCLRIGDVMASDQHVRLVPDADYFGGYFPDPPQVTPAGSRLEGLTAAYLLARRMGRPLQDLRATIERGATFQVRMQIRPEFDHLFPNPALAQGTFRHSPVAGTNRIDYNQHNISGLIVATKILESPQ